MQEMQVQSLGQEDAWGKKWQHDLVTTHTDTQSSHLTPTN